MEMKVGIIGASAAGLYSAILLKRAHPDFEVTLFEKNDRVGKKLAATGNGHCNLLNRRLSYHHYHKSPLAKALFAKYPYETLEKTLTEMGACLISQGDLVYPMSYHAPSFVKFLLDTTTGLGVNIVLSKRLISYKKKKGDQYELVFEDESLLVDKVIFAIGAKSQKKFGSDGALFEVFAEHGYEITPFLPSLCPIKVKERVKSLSGLRHKATVVALADEKPIYMEEGEVLFKDDGLSGIAIMNASSYLVRQDKKKNLVVCLDLFPGFSTNDLEELLLKTRKANPKAFLSTVIEKPIQEFLMGYCKVFDANNLKNEDIHALVAGLKCLRFTYAGNYDFDQSQVSIGGISAHCLTDHLESKKEKGVFFVGEALDVDGLCGGFNLSFALASSLEVVNSL